MWSESVFIFLQLWFMVDVCANHTFYFEKVPQVTVTESFLESASVSSLLECASRCSQLETCRSFSEVETGTDYHQCYLLPAKAYDMCAVTNNSSVTGSYYSNPEVQQKVFTLHNATNMEDECYEVQFPTWSITDYIQIDDVFSDELASAFSFCGWIKTTIGSGSNSQHQIWTWNNGNDSINLRFSSYQMHLVFEEDRGHYRDYASTPGNLVHVQDDKWHFICMSWSQGHYKFYVDAELIHSINTGHLTDYLLPVNRSLVIGQYARTWGDRTFLLQNAFEGKITGFNFYDYILSNEEVQDLFLYCYTSGGNLLAWSEMKKGLIGDATVSNDKPSCITF